MKKYGVVRKYELLEKIPQNDSIQELIKEIPNVIEDETKLEIMEILEKTMNDVRMGGIIERERAKKISKNIVKEILSRKEAMLRLIDIKDFDDYTFTHSINVCLLSVTTAMDMNYSREELEEIALGALFHDIGKIFIPNEILNKKEPLSEEEFIIIKQHCYNGYTIMDRERDFGEIPKIIAYEHHERVDGSGYPQGISGEQINNLAILISLSDSYDAITTDRPYRNKFLPYEAVKIILSETYRYFKLDIVKAFIRNISIYPPGSLVRLNTGEVGMVIRINKSSLIRPIIRILSNKSGEILSKVHDIDLLYDQKRYIVGPTDRHILPE
jgi:HD-GYP domain-containing protein (c-di-GMP phosphodiesterase class II)